MSVVLIFVVLSFLYLYIMAHISGTLALFDDPMNALLLLCAVALAPGAYLASAIYLKDKYEPEPKRLLFGTFCLGAAVMVVPALVEAFAFRALDLGQLRGLGILASALVAFLVIAPAEEGAKFWILRRYAYLKPDFNEPLDGIVYGAIISLGFATLENLLYVLPHGLEAGVARMLTAVPGHYAFGVVMGYYVGQAKFQPENQTALMLRGFCYATLLHGAYDFFLIQSTVPILKPGMLVVLLVALRMARKAIQELQADSKWRFGDCKRDHQSSVVTDQSITTE